MESQPAGGLGPGASQKLFGGFQRPEDPLALPAQLQKGSISSCVAPDVSAICGKCAEGQVQGGGQI